MGGANGHALMPSAIVHAWFRSTRGAWRPVRGLLAAAGTLAARRAARTRRGFVHAELVAMDTSDASQRGRRAAR